MKKPILVLSLLTVGFSTKASAGELFKYVDLLEASTFLGYEHSVVYTGSVQLNANKPVTVDHLTSGGALAGLRLGMRFAPLSLGVLFQEASDTVALSKTQGYLGFNAQYGNFLLLLDLRFGRNNLNVGNTTTPGLGGGLGLRLDYYLYRWMSLGLGFAGGGSFFDISPSQKAGSYDIDGLFNLGLHL